MIPLQQSNLNYLQNLRGVFDFDCLETLKDLYCRIYPEISTTSVRVNSIFKKYSSLTLRGKTFSSSGLRKRNPYVLMAEWKEDLYGPPPPDHLLEVNSNIRPIDAHFYVIASFVVDGVPILLHLAHVSWMFPHHSRYAIGKPAELWCRRKFEDPGIHSFVQLDDIHCRCAYGMMVHNDDNVTVVIPLVE